MTNLTHEVSVGAADIVQKQASEVTQAFAAEVHNGREILNVVLTWFAENGISFLVNLLVALLLLLIGSVIGAQIGTVAGKKLKADQLKILMASLVIIVMLKMLAGLLIAPAILISYKGGH